jgi:type IV pilus assembly protein PilV
MLLEALIAILIFSIGILAIVGMQATAVKAVTDARSRSEASFYANQLLSQIWTDAANADQYAYPGSGTIPGRLTEWHGRVVAGLPGAATLKPKVTISAFTAGKGGTVKVELFWSTPEEISQGLPAHNYTVVAAVYGN